MSSNVQPQSLCQLGRFCKDPQCKVHFPPLQQVANDEVHVPFLGKREERSADAGIHNIDSNRLQSQLKQRTTTSDLIELAVLLLCHEEKQKKKKGIAHKLLTTLRVTPETHLSEVRNILMKKRDEHETLPQLPENFSFIRYVDELPFQITSDQEAGDRAYKAKHFSRLYIIRDGDNDALLQDSTALDHRTKTAPKKKKKEKQDVKRSRMGRTSSSEMVEFCVKQISEQDVVSYRGDTSRMEILGMMRMNRDATMSEIRRELTKQLGNIIPHDYRFVRLLDNEITLLTRAQEKADGEDENGQESGSTRNLLRAYHFTRPYTKHSEIILLVKKVYIDGSIIACGQGETKNREYKSLFFPLHKQQSSSTGTKNPRDVIKDKVSTYINAFLNSSGGVILFGVNDDGIIERVPIYGAPDISATALHERVQLARSTKDDIRKLVDEASLKMDPTVEDDLVTVQFVPVRQKQRCGSEDIKNNAASDNEQMAYDEIFNVVEVAVRTGRQPVYFMNKHSLDAYERRDGSTHLIDASTVLDLLRNGKPSRRGSGYEKLGPATLAASQWRGGWRQLRSSFDFDKVMHRLSDPWAGREYCFAAVRQSIFLSISKAYQSSTFSCCGVGITGSRGMGKTSFMSELALRPKHVTSCDVVAHHLCRNDDPDTLNPSLFVHSIAAMLARNFKEFRSLMTAKTERGSESSSVGNTMLRALRPEHCESDPDDAFFRGVIQPLQEIDTQRRKHKSYSSQDPLLTFGFPLIILVDGLDESLASATKRPGRSSSSRTIAELLERAVSHPVRLFPPWIKLVVSFRHDILEIPGPIKKFAYRLKLFHLDPDHNNAKDLQQSREDIRMFLTAYIEKESLTTPLNLHKGRGKWDFRLASEVARSPAVLNGRKYLQYEYEEDDGKWVKLHDSVNDDIKYVNSVGALECFYFIGKRLFVMNTQTNHQKNIKTGKIQRIRCVPLSSPLSEKEPIQSVVTSSIRKHEIATNPDLESRPTSEDYFGINTSVGEVGKTKKILRSKGETHIHIKPTLAALEARENEILNAIASNAFGNYLYARTVLEDISSGHLQWEDAPNLPPGLGHLYSSFFERHFSSNDSAVNAKSPPLFRAVQPVLEILLAAPKRGITEREIAHAILSGCACDPTAASVALKDMRWALDIDNSGDLPRYRLRHESIRTWLQNGGDTNRFKCQKEEGHRLLAASLLQRCWPQQTLLSAWLHSSKNKAETSNALAGNFWYDWDGWEANGEDEDVYNLVMHLVSCSSGERDETIKLLKSIGPDLLNSLHKGKVAAIHSASLSGNTSAVKMLLDASASPNVADTRGRCPMHLAASRGFSDSVRLLLSAGAKVEAKTFSGRTPLLYAAARGSIKTVECILEAIALKNESSGMLNASPVDTGRTSLSIAAEEGHDQVIMMLLKANALVALADRWGRTPIYYAARFGRLQPSTIKALANAPGGQNTLLWGDCVHKRSPLHAAVWHGHAAVVQALLESGADPNLVENDGGSPLHEASYFGSLGNKTWSSKVNASHGQLVSKDTRIVTPTGQEEETTRLKILQTLLESSRCEVNLGEVHGCVPLWYAASKGWTLACKALLDAGACIDPGEVRHSPNKNRKGPASPLLLAIKCGHYETANFLLSRGARVPPPSETDDFLETDDDCPDSFICAIQKARSLQGREINSKDTNAQGIVDYTMATKCESVPRNSFAQWPPVVKAQERMSDI